MKKLSPALQARWGDPIGRFLDHYIPEPNSGCWFWEGSLDDNGYARFEVDGIRILVHRYSYKIHHPEINLDDDPEICVLHSCDIRCCINPDHLFLGTRQNNTDDCVKKGRQTKGVMNGRAELTEIQVLQIRNDTRSNRIIGKEYEISHSTVGRIKTRKIWKHLT